MESVLLLLDCIAIVLVVHWFVRNQTRQPGEPVGGLLRYHQTPRSPATPPARPKQTRR
jgi:hypothetical protein